MTANSGQEPIVEQPKPETVLCWRDRVLLFLVLVCSSVFDFLILVISTALLRNHAIIWAFGAVVICVIHIALYHAFIRRPKWLLTAIASWLGMFGVITWEGCTSAEIESAVLRAIESAENPVALLLVDRTLELYTECHDTLTPEEERRVSYQLIADEVSDQEAGELTNDAMNLVCSAYAREEISDFQKVFEDTALATRDEFVRKRRKTSSTSQSVVGFGVAKTPESAVDTRRLHQCYEELFPDEYDKVVRIVNRRTPTLEDSKDIVAEAMLKVCLRHAKAEIQNLPPYFMTAALNQRKSFFRKNPYSCDLTEWNDTGELPDELSEFRFRKAWCSLSEQDQQILELRANGIPFNEIASMVNATEGSLKTRHSRALEKLLTHYTN